MLRIKDTQYPHTAAFLSAAIGIAEYYGFSPLEDVLAEAKTKTRSKRVASPTKAQFAFARKDERALSVLAKRYSVFSPTKPAPFLAWRTVASSSSAGPAALELHMIGTNNPIAEAMLIVVADAIISEAGILSRTLAINNVGTSESNGRFVRDVGTFLRKHIETIAPALRTRAGSDPIGTLIQLIERGHPIVPRAPQSMEYLTEEERRRFWDLLEYIEVSGISYELSPQVLGSRDCWSQTLFEIVTTDPQTNSRITLATGGRYDPMASRFARMPLPAVMVSIASEQTGPLAVSPVQAPAPAIYFAQIGTEARRRALPVIELLRKAGIPIHQRIYHDSIGEQMAFAQQTAAPYLIIMGHKEVIEDSVLVREVSSNSQHSVPVSELVSYLKRRRIPRLAR